jgi:NADH-quinone oxidoreductase subunit J
MISAPLFYGFSTFIVFFALLVLLSANPIVAALALAAAMVGVAGVFFALGAHFIAAVQVTVYAGAVMVLFVIVLMLFDLKKEEIVSSSIVRFFKISVVGLILGLITGAVTMSGFDGSTQIFVQNPADVTPTKKLAVLLFDKYLFAFEVLGVLLLVIAIGVVSVSRIKGGTHAKS